MIGRLLTCLIAAYCVVFVKIVLAFDSNILVKDDLGEAFEIQKPVKKIDIACINENNDIKINGNNKLKINLENGQVANIIDNTSTLDESLTAKIQEENESSTA